VLGELGIDLNDENAAAGEGEPSEAALKRKKKREQQKKAQAEAAAPVAPVAAESAIAEAKEEEPASAVRSLMHAAGCIAFVRAAHQSCTSLPFLCCLSCKGVCLVLHCARVTCRNP
jgi:hypothetical protein